MTNQEARQAFLDDAPVIHNGIEYARICALTARKKEPGGEIFHQVQLLDIGGNSVAIANPAKVYRKNQE